MRRQRTRHLDGYQQTVKEKKRNCTVCNVYPECLRIRCFYFGTWCDLCAECTFACDIKMDEIGGIIMVMRKERMDTHGPWASKQFFDWCIKMRFHWCGIGDILSIQAGSKNSYTATTYHLEPQVYQRKTDTGSLENIIGIVFRSCVLDPTRNGEKGYEYSCVYVPTESPYIRGPWEMGGGTVYSGDSGQRHTIRNRPVQSGQISEDMAEQTRVSVDTSEWSVVQAGGTAKSEEMVFPIGDE